MIEATVLSISRCRSKGFISMVDIRVTFDSARMGLSTVSEFCHSDFFAEYDEDCNDNKNDFHGDGDGTGDGCDSSGDNDGENDNDDDDDAAEEEGNTSHTTRIIDTEEIGSEAPICLIPTIAFTVENIKKPATAADYRYLHYPTLRIRTIKRALSLCGHQIVGDGGAVKSAKGLFACVVSVTMHGLSPSEFQSALLSSEKEVDIEKVKLSCVGKLITICVDDPKKFAKLMVKEHELWESAQQRDNDVMIAWQALSLQHSADVVKDVESILIQESLHSVGDNNDNISNGRDTIDEISTTCNGNASNLINQESYPSVATRFKSIDEMRSAMASGMPVEYVLGEATFCGLKFCVNKDVMVPRKSSEVLVMEAIKVISNDMLFEDTDVDRFHSSDEVYNQSNQMKCQTGTIEIIENETQVHENQYNNKNVDNKSNNNENKTNDESRYGSKSCIAQKRLRVLDIGTGSGCLLLSCLTNLNCLYRDRGESKMKCKIKNEHTDTTTQTIIGMNMNRNRDMNMNMNMNMNRDINYLIEGVGIDLSQAALQVARTNSHSLGLQGSTVFKILDFTNLTDLVPATIHSVGDTSSLDVPCGLKLTDNDYDTPQEHVESLEQSPAINLNENYFGPYDIILCNPPYSSKRDTTRLSKACREHEPSLALFSPDGPLSAYKTLAIALMACEAKKKEITTVGNIKSAMEIGLLKKNAHLFLEVGHGQALPVQKILNKLDFLTFIGIAKDHKDIDRCLIYKYNET